MQAREGRGMEGGANMIRYLLIGVDVFYSHEMPGADSITRLMYSRHASMRRQH